MSRWFRFYEEALNDPKVQRLDGDTFKAWVNLLCLASKNDGKLPCLDDVAFALRETLDGARTVVERLLNGGLIDRLNGGPDGWHYAPHGWTKRQFKSDTSTDRVKRFRQRSKTVSETPPETETETDIPLAKANGHSPDSDKAFWDTAVSYLGGDRKRSLIGKWCRDFGQDATAKAITAAQLERAVEPVAFIERTLRNGSKAGGMAMEGFIV